MSRRRPMAQPQWLIDQARRPWWYPLATFLTFTLGVVAVLCVLALASLR